MRCMAGFCLELSSFSKLSGWILIRIEFYDCVLILMSSLLLLDVAVISLVNDHFAGRVLSLAQFGRRVFNLKPSIHPINIASTAVSYAHVHMMLKRWREEMECQGRKTRCHHLQPWRHISTMVENHQK